MVRISGGGCLGRASEEGSFESLISKSGTQMNFPSGAEATEGGGEEIDKEEIDDDKSGTTLVGTEVAIVRE